MRVGLRLEVEARHMDCRASERRKADRSAGYGQRQGDASAEHHAADGGSRPDSRRREAAGTRVRQRERLQNHWSTSRRIR